MDERTPGAPAVASAGGLPGADLGWHNEAVPAQQRALAQRELVAWRAGSPHGPFDAFRALWAVPDLADVRTVLEVGAGAGYYSELLAELRPNVAYEGCDYSEAMVGEARRAYPNRRWQVADQRRLPYADRAFDLAINGCALLHLSAVADWARTIREAARVARRWVFLHRVPVVPAGNRWGHVTKTAYGVTIHETYVPVVALLALTEAAGLVEETVDRWNRRAAGAPGDLPECWSVLYRKEPA